MTAGVMKADISLHPAATHGGGVDEPVHEFLTVEEAAVVLKVSPQTVRNELASRRLPGKKIGKEWRLSHTALIAYLSTPGEPRAASRRASRVEGDGGE